MSDSSTPSGTGRCVTVTRGLLSLGADAGTATLIGGNYDCTSVVVDGLPDGPLLMNALAQNAKKHSALALAMAAATVAWTYRRAASGLDSCWSG